jgi:hypothetical protein
LGSQPLGLRVPLAYFAEDVFFFDSRLPFSCEGRGQHVIGKGKLKAITNIIYLLLRRIDRRLWDNRLMQILEIDQSIDRPHKILRGV